MTDARPHIPLVKWISTWYIWQQSDAQLRASGPERTASETIAAFREGFGRLETSPPADQWAALLQTATIDVAVARTVEPHLDALTILTEAGHPAPDNDSYWGVYAAEAAGASLGRKPPIVSGSLVKSPGARWPVNSPTPSSTHGSATNAKPSR